MPLRQLMLCTLFALTAVLRAAAQGPPGRLSLTIADGRVTCAIENSPIGEVLQEFGARTQVNFVTSDNVADDRISLNLDNVPFEEAVRRLLRRYDAFLYYGGTDSAPASLRAVWIYPKGSGAALQPVPPESWAATPELQQGVRDPDPAVRERAYVALMSRHDAVSREMVLNALRGATENDDGVRQRLLSSAVQQAMDIPPDLLADVARTDASEVLRLLALDALAVDAAVKDVAASLLQDPSSLVQRRAKEILAEWDTLPSR
jgi:type II secretory pathway component GspD/PulD (secretin)